MLMTPNKQIAVQNDDDLNKIKKIIKKNKTSEMFHSN